MKKSNVFFFHPTERTIARIREENLEVVEIVKAPNGKVSAIHCLVNSEEWEKRENWLAD